MNKSLHGGGTELSRPDEPPSRALSCVERLLGQRRALAAVGGRCSAANAQLLRRLRDEKLFLPLAPTWRAFCSDWLQINRRRADRIIALLNRLGPLYFELAELIDISPQQFVSIEPAIHEDSIVVDGQAISFIPENAPELSDAVQRLASLPVRRRRQDPEHLAERVATLAARVRAITAQLVRIYHSTRSPRERELIIEAATDLRIGLMQLENE